MGSTVIPAVPEDSIDRWGLSVVTGPPGADPRAGSAYRPVDFAAAVPVHFHPMGGSRFLMLTDRRWTNAVPSSTPGRYSSHSEVIAPASAVIDANSGSLELAPLQFRKPTWTTAQLVNAVSVARFVYMMLSTDTGPVLAIWRLDPEDRFVIVDQIPIVDITLVNSHTVRFNRGVYVDGPYLYLWGTDVATNEVYTARQFTSRVGIDAWDYQTDSGWHASGATKVTGLATVGPMSTLVFRKRTYVTTVALSGGIYYGQVWASRSMSERWTLLENVSINASGTWLGNGLMLQPQVTMNMDAMPDGAAAAIPMVTTSKGGVGGEGLDVSWDFLTITE